MARSFNQLTLVGYLRRDPESTMVADRRPCNGVHCGDQREDERKRDVTTAAVWVSLSMFDRQSRVLRSISRWGDASALTGRSPYAST